MLQASAVARLPSENGPPTLVEVDGFVSPWGWQLTEALNQPEELSFTIDPKKQTPELLLRFSDLAAYATEIWLWEDGELIFAGPLLGYAPRLAGEDIAWEVRATGLLSYLQRWRVRPSDPDLVFSGVDQALIAKGLIDYWQALPWGDYGIDTSSVATTGVTRDRTYAAVEAHLIAQRLSELAAVIDGFDFSIDPATREFLVHYPGRGQDLTDSIIVDSRSVADPSAQISAGPEDLVSDAYALGEDGLSAEAFDAGLRAAIGRSAFAGAFAGVTDPTTLADYAARLQVQRSTQLHIPPSTLIPVAFRWGDFGVGDLVEFNYDYGAGLLTEERRVLTRQRKVEDSGAELITVGLV